MTSHPLKYHIITLGCQMNISDSERVLTIMNEAGYQQTGNEKNADLLGILACSVRQKAIDKVFSKIQKWNRWKNNKSIITFLTGCVLPADREKFLRLFDIIFPMSELNRFPEMIKQYGIVTPASATNTQDLEEMNRHIKKFWNIPPSYESSFEAYIPIQNGCDKFCTFCAVPYTRGREFSRPSGEIMKEFRSLVNKGYKSITLLGQNVNSYGYDKKGREIYFPQLLQKMGEYGNASGREFWIYFTSPHPHDMTDEVIDTIAEFDCIGKQIHLPLQSGDDELLARMNRKYSLDDYRSIMNKIRNTIPDATVFTDIIVGFPGETEKQFDSTIKAMKEFKFNMAYIAQYSPRPGAKSSKWKDGIPYRVKKQRYHRLTEELQKHALAQNEKLLGKKLRVLVTGKDRKKGYLSGYTEGRIVIRFASDNESLIGNFKDVIITSATPYSIEGKLFTIKEHSVS